jgi:hypothetical protein
MQQRKTSYRKFCTWHISLNQPGVPNPMTRWRVVRTIWSWSWTLRHDAQRCPQKCSRLNCSDGSDQDKASWPGRASHELSNQKTMFPTCQTSNISHRVSSSSMAMMTCQLSPCERYRPVRRWWNHFIIYKNHPSTWCLRFPMGSKNLPSIPIQLANSRCDPPHVGTTEQENIIHYTIWTFDGKHHAKC